MDEIPSTGFQIGSNESEKSILSYPASAFKGNQKLNITKAAFDNNIELNSALERMDNIINSNAMLEDDTTNPGVVITNFGLPIELYWQAVREVVKLDEIKKLLKASGAIFKGYKNGRGIIGASAAIAWGSQSALENRNPKLVSNIMDKKQSFLDHTYELITYREASRWGTVRQVDPNAVKELDKKFPSTFNNYDYENNHVVITPNSPCPVLFGIRGDSVNDLHAALPLLIKNSEAVDKWLIFKTNQGTDDHLILTDIPLVLPYSSVILTGRVSKLPYTISGGHVLFNIEHINSNSALNQNSEFDKQSTDLKPNESSADSTKITCAAYEPTKGFRNIVKKLIPGDIVNVYGSVREQPLTINVEKLKINELTENIIKLHNPRCPSCKKSMKSIGHGKGFRCRACHQVLPLAQAPHASMPRNLNLGFYEVPVVARRHLSKPLKRFKLHPGYTRDQPKTL